ncbi:hypothetical protein GOQ29_07360 [Clostridium sp. D2Q-14]|uniref:hypothetical protein n=1 Tax=Anaeromonas gelatinilytica TaxID=2683194 RepID=UPI00193B422A|nr:hypothetical protein [Anaeromonas gelatinilytica]MBS4535436.1 hypothetical protein [Anaeromonas gelatinilytica]
MKIINNISSKYQKLNRNNDLEVGSTLDFTFKEKLSKDTAIINVNGKDIKAKFNKSLDGIDDSKGKIYITNIDSDGISVDYVENSKVNNDIEALNKLEGIEGKELKKIIKTLRDKGVKLSDKEINQIRKFIEKDNSPLEEKIDILNRLVDKSIDITLKNIISIKETLFGDGIDVNLNDILEIFNLQIDLTILNGEEDSIDLKLDEKVVNDLSDKILENFNKNKDEKNIDNNSLLSRLEDKENDNLDLSSYPENILSTEFNGQKKVLMTIVTEKMNLINENFKDLKNTLVKNMDRVIFDNTINKEDIKESLENSLDYLNRKILKSDITLYTDMLTEKKLIKISSKIDMAKNLVSKNNIKEGKILINEIKEELNKIEFKASEEKIVYGLSKEISKDINGSKDNINSSFDIFKNPPSGARQVYDYMKNLGLNYEKDILNDELFNLNNINLEENLKGNLLKIMSQENRSIKDISSIMKVLDNLNGQQLLNKLENNNSVQTMFFDIPVNLVGKIENMKLIVNSNKENEKIDWKNSSLYFLIETDKLGETGILINSQNRNLDITIRNDNNKIKNKIAFLEDELVDKLKDIGYNVNRIRYDKFSKEKIDTSILDKPLENTSDEFNSHRKGLDIRI